MHLLSQSQIHAKSDLFKKCQFLLRSNKRANWHFGIRQLRVLHLLDKVEKNKNQFEPNTNWSECE